MEDLLTQKDINDKIVDEVYHHTWKSNVICALTLKNGFEVTGTAYCRDLKNHVEYMLSRQSAKAHAFSIVWMLERYLQYEEKYQLQKRQ